MLEIFQDINFHRVAWPLAVVSLIIVTVAICRKVI